MDISYYHIKSKIVTHFINHITIAIYLCQSRIHSEQKTEYMDYQICNNHPKQYKKLRGNT